MGRGYLQKFIASTRWRLILAFLLATVPVAAVSYWLAAEQPLNPALAVLILAVFCVSLSVAMGIVVSRQISQPFQFLAQAILHVSPSENLVAAPDMNKLRVGRELVTNLTRQVYEFASGGAGSENGPDQTAIMQQLPIAVLGLDSKQKIIYANTQAEQYLPTQKSLVGENFFGSLNLSYEDSLTLADWLSGIKDDKVTANRTWERIRLNINNAQPKYFDMSASFSKHSSSGVEVLIAIFDHTQTYSAEDRSVSFVALAVHELRTPLTLLRGYIEVFEEEMGDKLSGELKDFMYKMRASSESLTTFVSNILNVAKVDQDDLVLKLSEENWPQLLEEIVSTMQLRASVHGKSLELRVDKDLPTVAVDKVSIAEVVNNLIDNAIKYSPQDADRIIISSSMDNSDTIETTVQDFGIGIPSSVMPHLFEKFYRNHRSKNSVGGSGLGLYLSKAIISAHSGNIWARSDEERGATFGFSILPYSQLAEERKNTDNKNITRGTHGWIKNHSLQRR